MEYFCKFVFIKGLHSETNDATASQADVNLFTSNQGERVATFRHNGTMVIIRTISILSQSESGLRVKIWDDN